VSFLQCSYDGPEAGKVTTETSNFLRHQIVGDS
jgi:hypothetical protein